MYLPCSPHGSLSSHQRGKTYVHKIIRDQPHLSPTHTRVHAGPFPLAYVLLLECVVLLPSSHPLHMLRLVNSHFLLDFNLSIAFSKIFLSDFPPTESKLTCSALLFQCTLCVTFFQLITFNTYVLDLLVIDFIPASQTHGISSTKAGMYLIC